MSSDMVGRGTGCFAFIVAIIVVLVVITGFSVLGASSSEPEPANSPQGPERRCSITLYPHDPETCEPLTDR